MKKRKEKTFSTKKQSSFAKAQTTIDDLTELVTHSVPKLKVIAFEIVSFASVLMLLWHYFH